MQDRAHPSSILQMRMSEKVGKVLDVLLNSKNKPSELNSATYFNNAD